MPLNLTLLLIPGLTRLAAASRVRVLELQSQTWLVDLQKALTGAGYSYSVRSEHLLCPGSTEQRPRLKNVAAAKTLSFFFSVQNTSIFFLAQNIHFLFFLVVTKPFLLLFFSEPGQTPFITLVSG